MPAPYLILPSILNADFGRLRQQIQSVEMAGAQWLHLDIMDGHFVPNISFGPDIVAQIRTFSTLKFDTHLMIDTPEKYVEPFSRAGSDSITIHGEVKSTVMETLHRIRELGCRRGLAVNPDTPLSQIQPFLPNIDLLLIMSVHPGFGGQQFIPAVNNKIREAKAMIQDANHSIILEVDGGIGSHNIERVIQSGPDWIVIGSAIYKASDPGQMYRTFANTSTDHANKK